MSRWKEVLLVVVTAIAVVASAATILEKGRADRAEDAGAVSAAQVTALTKHVKSLEDRLDAFEDALTFANAKLDALNAEQVPVPGNGSSSTTTTPPTTSPSTAPAPSCTTLPVVGCL